jgi:hypothetical protein
MVRADYGALLNRTIRKPCAAVRTTVYKRNRISVFRTPEHNADL